MTALPTNFRRKRTQAIHIFAMPLSFFAFMLIYRPFNVEQALSLGRFSFEINLTLISCIIFGSMILVRGLFYALRHRIDTLTYFFWSIFEMVVAVFFVALYAWLMERAVDPYFLVVSRACKWVLPVLIFPYVIVTLALFLANKERQQIDESESAKMRFYDERRNLKLVVATASVLYIAAEENYINIYYQEGEKMRNYLVRASMKSIEELCGAHNLLRCHRSYYINPRHVKVLRKNREGTIFAELDTVTPCEVPVTKRYYDVISSAI